MAVSQQDRSLGGATPPSEGQAAGSVGSGVAGSETSSAGGGSVGSAGVSAAGNIFQTILQEKLRREAQERRQIFDAQAAARGAQERAVLQQIQAARSGAGQQQNALGSLLGAFRGALV